MRLPIALALGWPDRVPDAAPGCDWTTASTWEFLPLDDAAFPAVQLARRAGLAGGTAPAVLNAANEVCVEAFLAGALAFPVISDTVAAVLGEHEAGDHSGLGNHLSLADVLSAETWARGRARHLTSSGSSTA
jgi:1-deoxy-D-xylulose-5-phosphate reductoisomerase